MNEQAYAVFNTLGFRVGLDGDETEIQLPERFRPMEKVSLIRSVQEQRSFCPITKIKVTYQEGTALNRDILNRSKTTLERFLLLSAIDFRVDAPGLAVECESWTAIGTGGEHTCHFQDSIGLRDELTFFHSYGLASYEATLQDELICNAEAASDFAVLKAIFSVKNLESRYLLQYEFLKHLAGVLYARPKGGTEKTVKLFILERYNDTVKEWEKIAVRPSRARPNEEQDLITFYRNFIGHPPLDETEFQGVDIPATLQSYSRLLNKVIIFAIREKIRLGGGHYASSN